jgi:hypothetical protein
MGKDTVSQVISLRLVTHGRNGSINAEKKFITVKIKRHG